MSGIALEVAGTAASRILVTLSELDADVLVACYGIDVDRPGDAPLDQAIAAWWAEGRPLGHLWPTVDPVPELEPTGRKRYTVASVWDVNELAVGGGWSVVPGIVFDVRDEEDWPVPHVLLERPATPGEVRTHLAEVGEE